MGNSASKTRSLKKSAETVSETLLKQHKTSDHLNNLKSSRGSNPSPTTRSFTNNKESTNGDHQIFTQRPPEELENVPGGKSISPKPNASLLDKAIKMGVVNIKETPEQMQMDLNHESLKVLEHRKEKEKEYEGLFVPKNFDEPDTPERFLSEEQKKKIIERNKPEYINKKRKNVFGLLDSRRVSDLIIDYKIDGEEGLSKIARELEINNENLSILKELIDSGIINLPTNKVILDEVKDHKTKQIKQQLKVVKDDWVQSYKDEINQNKQNEQQVDKDQLASVKQSDILNQIQMLEQLVSKSQISVKKVGKSTNEERGAAAGEEEEERVLNRPKKVLVKEVTRNL